MEGEELEYGAYEGSDRHAGATSSPLHPRPLTGAANLGEMAGGGL